MASSILTPNPTTALQSASAVPKLVRGAITYVAGTTGAIGTTTLFTVTGDVLITSMAAKCATDLTSGGIPTFLIGVTGSINAFWSEALDVTTLDAGKWLDVDNGAYAAASSKVMIPTAGDTWTVSADIIQTIATATITGGVVNWYVQYVPLSADGAIALHSNLAAI